MLSMPDTARVCTALSADDVIFSVANSDTLVRALRKINQEQYEGAVRYTRLDRDQEGFAGTAVQGHSTGITASKSPEVYRWLLSVAAGS